MKELLIYALEVLVCSAALLLAYSVLLERRTAFLHCRLYLIGAMLLAALIPALSIPVWTGETLYMQPIPSRPPHQPPHRPPPMPVLRRCLSPSRCSCTPSACCSRSAR